MQEAAAFERAETLKIGDRHSKSPIQNLIDYEDIVDYGDSYEEIENNNFIREEGSEGHTNKSKSEL